MSTENSSKFYKDALGAKVSAVQVGCSVYLQE